MASRKQVLTAVSGFSGRVVEVCCEVSEESLASIFRVTIWFMWMLNERICCLYSNF